MPNFTIDSSAITSYAYTLRRTNLKKGQPTRDHYIEHIGKLAAKTNSFLLEFVFEQTGGLHMHGILEIPKNGNLQLFRVRGWKLHLEELWDYQGWRYYMMKEQCAGMLESSDEDTESFIEEKLPKRTLTRSLFRRDDVSSVSD